MHQLRCCDWAGRHPLPGWRDWYKRRGGAGFSLEAPVKAVGPDLHFLPHDFSVWLDRTSHMVSGYVNILHVSWLSPEQKSRSFQSFLKHKPRTGTMSLPPHSVGQGRAELQSRFKRRGLHKGLNMGGVVHWVPPKEQFTKTFTLPEFNFPGSGH